MKARNVPIFRGTLVRLSHLHCIDGIYIPLEFFKQERNIFGPVLQVSVRQDDDVAGGVFEACGNSGMLAKVPTQLDRFHAEVLRSQIPENFPGVVRIIVVNHEKFKIQGCLVQRVFETLDKFPEVSRRLVDRQHDGHARHDGWGRRNGAHRFLASKVLATAFRWRSIRVFRYANNYLASADRSLTSTMDHLFLYTLTWKAFYELSYMSHYT